LKAEIIDIEELLKHFQGSSDIEDDLKY